MRRCITLTLCGVIGSALLLCDPTGSAAVTGPVGAVISVTSSGIKLIVTQPTDLGEVLVELCKVAAADCEGADLASASTVAPLTLSGRWDEVVAQLMEGSGLNYVSVSPSQGQVGRIWITSLQSNQSASADECRFAAGSRRRPRGVQVVSGQQSSCAAADKVGVETGPSAPSDQGVSATDPVSETQAADRDPSSNRGSGSPFPDAAAAANSGTQTQGSGSPFPESLATK
jgi:hypothetical protein